eukprot:gene24140-9725_t
MDLEVNPLGEDGRYEKVQTLGKGSFGFVLLARNQQGELAAIKFLKRGEVNKYVEAEIVNHSLLRHPHVIQFNLAWALVSVYREIKQGTPGTIPTGADFCQNTLLKVVKGLPLPLLKICDFGYSKADFKSAAKSKVGTLTYMAPEVLVNRDGMYDGKVADIWSCGVMLYVMLYGRYPFDTPPGQNNVPKAAEILQMLDKMVNMRYPMPDGVEISPEGRDLLQRMLLPDPAQRVQLEQIMVHPWFTTNLPPEAATMNTSYLKAGLPAGHQRPEDIKRLLEDAKNKAVAGVGADGFDANDESIEHAIQEDLARHQGKSMAVTDFINQHQR